ncbi:hypothetical protein [Arthrobacter sunyaminii]|uniref:hypothetical protein n=1 Tax=Arthrobacter sunyaminii TaxID=2816859 RepID=UPI001A94ECD3|nr:hypothetical protein [Arthrobacter sunyaminii]MBO0896116.1 hypothetical protein [Arthrobacter sunyaminii]
MLDYASRLWGLDLDEFDARWRPRTGASLFGDAVDGGTELRDAVEQNLSEGPVPDCAGRGCD